MAWLTRAIVAPSSFAVSKSCAAAEQSHIVRLLVERVDRSSDGLRVRPGAKRLQTLVEELRSREARAA
jgi:hypothetical protein